jgi:DNA-binding cell septation regulator SpoVG
MEVHVVRFVHPPLTRPRSVLALARITITFDNHHIAFDDLRVVQNRQGELWVAMPSMKDASGVYQAIVEFSPDLRQLIASKILAAFRQWSPGAARETAQTEANRG